MNNKGQKLIYPDLSYQIVGAAYQVHNQLGRHCREAQYTKALYEELGSRGLQAAKEEVDPKLGNRADLIVENKVIIELKAKPYLSKDDYFQIQRYLQCYDIKLGLLINFRDKFLRPRRIVKIETGAKNRYHRH